MRSLINNYLQAIIMKLRTKSGNNAHNPAGSARKWLWAHNAAAATVKIYTQLVTALPGARPPTRGSSQAYCARSLPTVRASNICWNKKLEPILLFYSADINFASKRYKSQLPQKKKILHRSLEYQSQSYLLYR